MDDSYIMRDEISFCVSYDLSNLYPFPSVVHVMFFRLTTYILPIHPSGYEIKYKTIILIIYNK